MKKKTITQNQYENGIGNFEYSLCKDWEEEEDKTSNIFNLHCMPWCELWGMP